MLLPNPDETKKLAEFSLKEIFGHPSVKALLFSALAAIGPIVGTALFATWKIAKNSGYRSGLMKIRDEYGRAQYEKVYAPLYYHFCDNPVMSNSVIMYSMFSQRWKRSMKFIGKSRITEAITSLFDKGIISSTEMVFGIEFPRNEIAKVLKDNHHICDKNILDLYAYLNFEDFENASGTRHDKDSFTNAELDLYNHITKMFIKLNSKYLK